MHRVIALTLWVTAGGVLALMLTSWPVAAVLGCLAGALAWWVRDQARLQQVLRWLRDPSPNKAPVIDGTWGKLVQRVRRALKAANRKARKSNARLQEFLAAIQASPNGVVLLSKDGSIEWCNLMAAEHLGFDAKRDVGQRFRNLVRDPAFIAYLNHGDFRQPLRIDGGRARPGYPQQIAIQLFPYAKGRRVLLTQDVTAVELAEAMRRDFVANVSHEIRSPLTVIVGFIETLQSLALTEGERARYLELMRQQAERMQALISDLLILSRLEGSPAPDATQWSEVADLIEEALTQARALADVLHAGQQALECAEGPPAAVAGSRSELLSALGNLLSNAVRYTPANGRVEVGWRLVNGDELEMYVTDTGPGIAPEHLPRLTERFYRVDRSRSRDSGGTGLGLAIVKHVIQRHSGQLFIESQVGKGSTFCLRLPSARVRVHEVA